MFFKWAAVPGGRFSNTPTSQSPTVVCKAIGHTLTKIKQYLMDSLLFSYKKLQNLITAALCCRRIILFVLILFCTAKQVVGQYSYVVNIKEANIRAKASTKSSIIGKFYYGDTVTLKYVKGDWFGVGLSNGETGFIYKTNLRMVQTPIYQTELKPVESLDLAKWDFTFLFSATIKYFLIITGFILFIILLIYYLK